MKTGLENIEKALSGDESPSINSAEGRNSFEMGLDNPSETEQDKLFFNMLDQDLTPSASSENIIISDLDKRQKSPRRADPVRASNLNPLDFYPQTTETYESGGEEEEALSPVKEEEMEPRGHGEGRTSI